MHGGVLLPIKIPKVKCCVCGQELKYINSTHLWMKHNMTLVEYKEMFPNSEVMCDKEKENAARIARPSKSQIGLIDVVKNVFGVCESEYPVRCKDGKLCLIDAAVPELFLAFEFDGKFWHKIKSFMTI